MLWILAAVFAFFAVLNFALQKLLHRPAAPRQSASLVLLCLLTIGTAVGAWFLTRARERSDTETLYQAYSYLLEGDTERADMLATGVEGSQAALLRLLADCRRGSYGGAALSAEELRSRYRLTGELDLVAGEIADLSRRMSGQAGTPLPTHEAEQQIDELAEQCFRLLELNEEVEAQLLETHRQERAVLRGDYDALDAETLAKLLAEAPKDPALRRYAVKAYSEQGKLEQAESEAQRLLELEDSPENRVLYTEVIARRFTEELQSASEDAEVLALLEQAEEAERTAALYDPDSPRCVAAWEKAEELREQAAGIPLRRIANWLRARLPWRGDRDGVTELQLSRLYAAAGDEAEARRLLSELLMRSDDIGDSSPVKAALEQIKTVYLDGNASESDIAAVLARVAENELFLPDSALRRSYSTFLGEVLRYERISVCISEVDAADYPNVRVYMNVNGVQDGILSLANELNTESFRFTDNGFPITGLRRIEDDAGRHIAIALVIDGSGSMDGSRIENARSAVESCIRNMDPETQKLSIVQYENSARTLTALTGDASVLRSGAQQIFASGGTNISAGILGGLETLRNASGSKAIILMTDGEDGNPSGMPDAILAAQEAGVPVFTVSTGGGNGDYMRSIAEQTGGTFMEAVTDTELTNVYVTLQNYIVNNYCFAYTVTQGVESNPRLLTVALKDFSVSASRSYAHGAMILTGDGSYAVQSSSETLNLLYAEPAVLTAADIASGMPVLLHATGLEKGVRLLVNGNEVREMMLLSDSLLSFRLEDGPVGAVRLTLCRPDGSSSSADTLLCVEETGADRLNGLRISLGNSGSTLYAGGATRVDEHTLLLDGLVLLDELFYTDMPVTIFGDDPIEVRNGCAAVASGTVQGSGPAYGRFSVGTDNYGQLAYGGSAVKLLEHFGIRIRGGTVELTDGSAELWLPGFGYVEADAELQGGKLCYRVQRGTLEELEAQLHAALYGQQQKTASAEALRLMAGISEVPVAAAEAPALALRLSAMTIMADADELTLQGTAELRGRLGPFPITEGILNIDSSHSDAMWNLQGKANGTALSQTFNIGETVQFSMSAAGWKPESFTLQTDGLHMAAAEPVGGMLPCDTVTIKLPDLSGEPYGQLLTPLLEAAPEQGDSFSLRCESREVPAGIVLATQNSNAVVFTDGGVELQVRDLDELSIFGAALGGEITGTLTVQDRAVLLRLTVDGHLDIDHLDKWLDGRAELELELPRGRRGDGTVMVTVRQGAEELHYSAMLSGMPLMEDGFHAYKEVHG